MSIKPYPEKIIRQKIINKINPEIKKGRSKHNKGRIYIGKTLVARVKLPNEHKKIMYESKSQYIAHALKLEDDDFNDLIDCPLSGKDYFDLLQKKCG